MNDPKLIAITRIKNEIDIVEPFVRHHAQHFDRIIALDDGSTDGTYEVLQALRAEGLPLVLLREASIGYDQRGYMTRLMHMAVMQFGADWVAPLDADEFIEPPAGRSLAETLASYGPKLLSVGWSNFLWNGDEGEVNPVLRLTERMPLREDQRKVIVPAAAVIGKQVGLAQGNHLLMVNGHPHEGTAVDEAVGLCHYPIRSVAQYASKIAIGYLQYAADPDRKPGWGFQYEAPYRTLLQGLETFAGRLREDSRNYVVPEGEEVAGEPVRQPLRYLGGALTMTPAKLSPFRNILDYAEALARSRAEASRLVVPAPAGGALPAVSRR